MSNPVPLTLTAAPATRLLFDELHSLEVYNVKDYEAEGDGVTDDTAAITAAIAAMPVQGSYAGSGILYFPPGDYRHTGITLPANKRIRLVGAGAGVSTLRLLNNTNGPSLTLAARSGGSDGWWHEVSHIQIDGNKANQSSGHGIVVLSTRTFIHHVNVTNCKQDGIRSDPASFALSSSGNRYQDLYLVSNGGNGLYLGLQGYDPFLSNVFTTQNGGDGIQSATTNVFATNIHTADNTGNGISLVGATGGYGMWTNVYCHNNTLRGVSISGSGETGHQFTSSHFVGNHTGGVYISTTNGRIVITNSVVKDNIGPGVEIASCNFNILAANEFMDFQGSKTQTYGIVTTGTADYQTFAGNICRSGDHLTGAMSLVGTHDTITGNTGIVSTFQDRVTVADGITLKLKAGAPVDGDFVSTPPDGTMAVDSSGGRIYIRLGGGTWKASQVLLSNPVTSKTTTYTASSNDEVVAGDATGGAFTVTLPSAVGIAGRRYTVKKKDASANAVTIGTTSSQTIDGATTYALGTQWKYATVVSDGANWLVIASN